MVSLDITDTKLLDISDPKTLTQESPKHVPQVQQQAEIEPEVKIKKKKKRKHRSKEKKDAPVIVSKPEEPVHEDVEMKSDDGRKAESTGGNEAEYQPDEDIVNLKDDFELRQGEKRSSYNEGKDLKELTQNELLATQVSKTSPENPLVKGQTFMNKYIKTTPQKEDEMDDDSSKFMMT